MSELGNGNAQVLRLQELPRVNLFGGVCFDVYVARMLVVAGLLLAQNDDDDGGDAHARIVYKHPGIAKRKSRRP